LLSTRGKMLFVHEKGKTTSYYSFTWVIKEDSLLDEDSFHPMRISILDVCEIESLSIKGHIIPTLTINKRKYHKAEVPMLLALGLIRYLGINTAQIMDTVHNKIKCDLNEDNEEETSYILDERIFTCKESIYTRYGFFPLEEEEKNTLCQMTLQQIMEEYKPKLDNIKEYKESLLEKRGYRSREEREFNKQSKIAQKLIDEWLLLEDTEITIRDWLMNFDTTERNCKVVMIMSLDNDYLSGNSFARQTQFASRLATQRQSYYVNKNIKKTFTNIYSKGLPKE
jgi:hypothetical protein